MRNARLARHVLDQLAVVGVKTVAACAGARNAPLLDALHASDRFEVLGFFDERSAAFFGLGRARAEGSPVAIVTTSGTAAAECLPAVIEAHYARVPLLLLTADRPRRFRGTGAPQAIEQPGLFGSYVERCVDLEDPEDLGLGRWSRERPIHVNPCFDEPLLDGGEPEAATAPVVVIERPEPVAETAGLSDAIRAFRSRTRAPAVIVGELPASFREQAVAALLALRLPVYLEAHGGLREEPRLRSLRLLGGDRFVARACREGRIDGILRLGGVPTLRAWRDLDADLAHLPVLSFSHRPFAGLGRSHGLFPLEGLAAGASSLAATEVPAALLERDRRYADALRSLFPRFPRSEAALVRALSTAVPARSLVYLGNSLPIRHWDLAAEPSAPDLLVAGNRGANGIDGQLSTFMGMCRPGRPNLAVVGDLTALYDPSALWAVRHLRPETAFTIVVINNGGGGIFDAMFRDERYQNRHEIRFMGWAEQWGVAYEPWTEIPDRPRFDGRRIVELSPDIEETRAFRHALEDPWADHSD